MIETAGIVIRADGRVIRAECSRIWSTVKIARPVTITKRDPGWQGSGTEENIWPALKILACSSNEELTVGVLGKCRLRVTGDLRERVDEKIEILIDRVAVIRRGKLKIIITGRSGVCRVRKDGRSKA